MTSASTTRNRWPGVMKRLVSPRRRARVPPLGRRLERAQTRRADRDHASAARARMRRSRRGRRRDPVPLRRGSGASARSSASTGRKVPAPTWSVTVATRCLPQRARPAARREVQAGGGRGDRARPAGVDRLVALGVGRRRGRVRCTAAAAARHGARGPRAAKPCRRSGARRTARRGPDRASTEPKQQRPAGPGGWLARSWERRRRRGRPPQRALDPAAGRTCGPAAVP